MTNADMEKYGERRGGGLFWLWTPIVLILFAGGALSVAAYHFEPGLSIPEALAAGFGGLAGVIIGIFGAAIAVVVGLLGALVGLVTAGGAVAATLFIIASPVIAIILLVLLMRRQKSACPDPGAH